MSEDLDAVLRHHRVRLHYAKAVIARLKGVPNSEDAIRVLAGMMADALASMAAISGDSCDDF